MIGARTIRNFRRSYGVRITHAIPFHTVQKRPTLALAREVRLQADEDVFVSANYAFKRIQVGASETETY